MVSKKNRLIEKYFPNSMLNNNFIKIQFIELGLSLYKTHSIETKINASKSFLVFLKFFISKIILRAI